MRKKKWKQDPDQHPDILDQRQDDPDQHPNCVLIDTSVTTGAQDIPITG